VNKNQTQTRSDTTRCEQEWKDFFKLSCSALFQTALLLTADAVTAEAVLTKGIEETELSSPPEQTSLAAWQEAVVMQSIETTLHSTFTPEPLMRFMLQPGLQPVIEIERRPRICFVLRMLLGYTTAFCAQMLGIEESGVRMLFHMAVVQLQQKMAADGVHT
jgi:hypothetical protein